MFSFIIREDVKNKKHEVIKQVAAVVNSTTNKARIDYDAAVQEHRVNELPSFYMHLKNIKGIEITKTYDHVHVKIIDVGSDDEINYIRDTLYTKLANIIIVDKK